MSEYCIKTRIPSKDSTASNDISEIFFDDDDDDYGVNGDYDDFDDDDDDENEDYGDDDSGAHDEAWRLTFFLLSTSYILWSFFKFVSLTHPCQELAFFFLFFPFQTY